MFEKPHSHRIYPGMRPYDREATRTVYQPGDTIPRVHDWGGLGYVGRSGETLGYTTDRPATQAFLEQFLTSTPDHR